MQHSPTYSITLGECNSPNLLSSYNHTLQRSHTAHCIAVSCLCLKCRDPGGLKGCQDTELCCSGVGPSIPSSLKPDQHYSSHGRSTSPSLLTSSSSAEGLGRIQDRLNCVALGRGPFSPHTPDQCRAFPSHSQILGSVWA